MKTVDATNLTLKDLIIAGGNDNGVKKHSDVGKILNHQNFQALEDSFTVIKIILCKEISIDINSLCKLENIRQKKIAC